ncbi:hypothetical protein F4859DRAFT_488262 [Xylaria cf. heliscus]|nr:hypothetical protein F4859DRAFT_488262 [Xylaria cf. heliscus]
MDLSLRLFHSLLDLTEPRRYVATTPELTARVDNPSSGNGVNNDTGDPVVGKHPVYQMPIFGPDIDKHRTNVKDSVNPLTEIGHYGKPLMNKCNSNSSLEVESDEHQPGVTSSNIVGDCALSGSPVAAPSRGPPATNEILGLRTTAPLSPAQILFSIRGILGIGPSTVGSKIPPAHIYTGHSLLSPIPGDQGHTIASPFGICHYPCATQRHADGAARAQIGYYPYIPRWLTGEFVDYVINTESFVNPGLARFTARKAVEAIAMWQNIGVSFRKVSRDEPATFQIKYRDLPSDGSDDVYAEAFFPQAGPGTLFVYKLALETANGDYLANFLAHEIGHILGLRHIFAEEDREPRSLLWGSRNESSIMNRFADLSLYSVQEQDRTELRSFYDFTGQTYKGWFIRDFTPGRFVFPRAKPKALNRVLAI